MAKDWRMDGVGAVVEEAKQQQEKTNYHAVIPWHKLEKHLCKLERKILIRMRTATGDALLRTQGELQLIDRLMDLPEALTLTEEDDPNAGTHAKGKT